VGEKKRESDTGAGAKKVSADRASIGWGPLPQIKRGGKENQHLAEKRGGE